MEKLKPNIVFPYNISLQQLLLEESLFYILVDWLILMWKWKVPKGNMI